MPRDDLEAHVDDPTHDELDELTDTALLLSDQLDEETYKRAALTLAALAGDSLNITAEQLIDVASQQEQGESTDADADDGDVDVSDMDSPDGSNTPNAREMEANTEDRPAQGEPPDGSAAAAESGAEASDDDTTDTTADTDTGDENSLLDADELDLSDEEALAGIGKQPSESTHDDGSDGDTDVDSDKPHPTNVELDSPLHEAHTDLTATERDDYDLTSDDEQFMALIADAFRGDLDDYELTESMTGLRDRAGGPNVDKLEDLGYIETMSVLRRKYYSLTRTGWRVINDGVPGNSFGDHMEKMKHRVGVYLLIQHTKELPGVRRVESYGRYDGETFDMIAYNTGGDVFAVGEVETASNNKDALVEDYEKLADAPGKSIWVFPSHATFSESWNVLENEVLDHEYSDHKKDRANRVEEQLKKEPEAGADRVKVYSQLRDSN